MFSNFRFPFDATTPLSASLLDDAFSNKDGNRRNM
jgi:hypothetical protein